MTTPRPKTGEPRKTRQPLKIDRLPQSVRDAIETLYDRCTWIEIEDRSSQPYSKDWVTDGGGFIDWESLPLNTLELFPEMRLPKTSLQRWFDLRIAQARKRVLTESVQAREFAAAFVGRDLDGTNDAVMNAIRDQVFGLIQLGGKGNKIQFREELKDLTLALSRLQRVQIMERRVAVEEKAIQMKLDLVKKKTGDLIGDMEGREGKPPVQLTREDLLEKVREIYGAV